MTIDFDSRRRGRVLSNDLPVATLASLSPLSILGLVLIAALIIACNFDALAHLVGRWSRESDYSHGFLVPFFSGWLLWQRRALIESVKEPVRGRWLGVAFLALSALVRLFAVYFSFTLAQPVALIICVAGVPVLIGGFPALRWSWPAIVFLFFMVPLPGFLAGRLGAPLQHVATLSSTYVLQTLGVPAIASGNVIHLSHGKIGVVDACNGLGMLVMFGAVTVAAVFSLKLAIWQNVCLLVSSVGIAITANIFRISATGVAQEFIGAEFADKIFHDFAGLLMMPLAMLMLGFEVLLLPKLFPKAPERPLVVTRQTGRALNPIQAR